MKVELFFAVIIFWNKSCYCDKFIKDRALREKRSLVYPSPSQLIMIFGLGTPLQLDRESVIVGAFTKLLYNLPSNVTDLTSPGTINYRDDKSKTRWNIYKQFEKLSELYGLGGKICLLKAICQVTHTPFDHNHGLLGQLIQTFLTPSSTAESYENHEDQEYHSAEKLGRHVGEFCHALYPECTRTVLDVFSTTTELF
ncbi:uncharacterized protein LOC141535328 [Cotesia typhae]|uniref:uncharacterized protein LOC141535328 n=1 Tax=Cotesia typhae TaxID=2053667 RepID=UPI003D684DC5